MASHIQAYVDNVSELPERLKNNFCEMKKMDEQAQEMQRKVESAVGRMKEAATARQNSDLEEIRKDVEEGVEKDTLALKKLCEDKVSLAVQTYDLVESHIQRLDKDLLRFENELREELIAAGESLPSYFLSQQGKNAGGKGGRKRSRVGKHERKGTPLEQHDGLVESELLIDPNEPRYCSCNGVSYGDMVACDNPDCPVEWYHFGCVGLAPGSDPPDTWFCPLCVQST
uniref:PHD finger protein ING n=1 Tax=Picocystis salinarum TaxID=88271 RepID=A0A7S3XEX9_9CHLO|mmetsp:Transcript_8456/g.52874  ORF Transcript_8456/g.52874 Transcript_8456/m.52874 type:complete len:228 (-) Transcript_8456:470-1153(-)